MNRIKVCMAPGEGLREQDLRIALSHDPRFDPLQIDSGIPVDVQFLVSEPDDNSPVVHCMDDRTGEEYLEPSEYIYKIFNCELKECSDYISSALGKDGHLYCQHLSMRESGHPAMILVLGSDLDVSNAIIDSLQTRYKGKELAFQISNYEARLQDFEARSFANGIPVMRWKARPFSRLLSTAAQVLGDPSMMSYGPKPAEGERDLVAASLLFRGIGAKTLEPVMNEYRLALVPKGEYARQPLDMDGIGPKRAKLIEERIVMHYGGHCE